MCGIAGIYFKHEVSPETLTQLSAHFSSSLNHRGPDHFGTHIGSRFVFANLRLAIVDRAGGDQPIYSPNGRQGIVYNGEVYNWETLRKPLEDAGYPFKTHSDTESILAAYLAQGNACFEKLNGMFAACIWNDDANSFILVRDRFGSKPLYIYEDSNFFAFASEIKTLLGLPNIDTTLNPSAFQDYLTYRYTLAPHTFFQRIEKLPAGCVLHFDGNRQHKSLFAEVSMHEPETKKSPAAYIEELDGILHNAVQSQLMGEVPIGLLLSGGLDSSSIAYYMQRGGVNLKAYSIGFPEINEFDYSRDIARQFGFDYMEVCMTQEELFAGMDANILRLDEPIADPACFALSRLCQDIRKDVTVVLSGEGGDEMFAGYNQYLNALNPDLERNQCFAHYFYQSSNYDDANAWLKNKNLPPRYLRFKAGAYDAADTALNGMQTFDLRTWMPENLMMKADKILMAHSLEGRYPFLDLELYRFASRLPQEMKLPSADSRKHILLQLMADKLPKSIVERRKMGFSVPPIFFLQRLQTRFIATLDSLRNQPVADILDLDAIGALVQDFYKGKPIPAFKIWSLFVLVDWFARVYPLFRCHYNPDRQSANNTQKNADRSAETNPFPEQNPAALRTETDRKEEKMQKDDMSAQTEQATAFDFDKVDENEHLIPRPYGTLQTLNLDHLHRYAFAKSFCYNANVLDAAMGCGYASLILNCKQYTGIDIDPNMVAFANQHYQPLIQNATYKQGSVLELPVDSGSIDTYISFETIEHIQPGELGQYLKEVKRVLRPGGVFLCSTPIYRGDAYGLLAKYHPYEFQYNHFSSALINNGFLLHETWYQWPPYYTIQSVVPRFEQTQQLAPFIVVGVFKVPG
jgi:asparagine synthase (glutamine-hydrolysing)